MNDVDWSNSLMFPNFTINDISSFAAIIKMRFITGHFKLIINTFVLLLFFIFTVMWYIIISLDSRLLLEASLAFLYNKD